MTTTLRSILTAHAASSPLVYLSDGGTDWDAATLLDELDSQSDEETRELLDAEDEYTTNEQGIVRLDAGYQNSIPDYCYRAAWQLADTREITIAVPTLDALLDAAKQYGQLDSDMPTFGGDEPRDTQGIWSWDATRLLVGSCASDLMIIDRE